jgi:carboxyl-terminal processing protease
MARWPLTVVLGLVGAALHGGLWLRQQLAAVRGAAELARSWRRGLLLAHVGIFLSVTFLVTLQLYRIGTFPPLTQDRVASFDRLARGMEIAYPYFDLKGVDWDALVARYRPQIEAAESDEAYAVALESMLAELNDGHTGLTPPYVRNEGCYFAQTREIEGQAVVIRVGGAGLDAGLAVGSTVLTVDGRPLEEALMAVDWRLVSGSTERHRRLHAFQFLLHTPFGASRTLTFETPAGEERSAALSCPEDPAAREAMQQGGDIWGFLMPVARPRIVSRRLSSGIGYVRVPTLGVDLVDEFDAALDEMLDVPALILDLRGNGGGNSAYADQMAGRLLSEPFAYGRDTYAARLPTRAWRKHMTFRVTPREPVYTGPLVVIVERENFSSAEQFIISLVDSGRARTVGRPTSGGSGNPTVFRLPGPHDVRFSTANFVRNDGTPIEGVGLRPDVPVRWSVEDFRQGRDPDLEAAERLLLAEERGFGNPLRAMSLPSPLPHAVPTWPTDQVEDSPTGQVRNPPGG